jgi:putative toxin-antitoxin system antitoxin component (TIGR02293 family)
MNKKESSFNVNDWLEKPIKRTSLYSRISNEDDLSHSIVAEDGLATKYSRMAMANSIISGQASSNDYEVDIEPMLVPQTSMPEYFMDNYQKAILAANGITKQSFEHFKQKAQLDYNQISELLSVARNTLINKKTPETFDISISEKLISLAEVYTHGFDVFGDEKSFIKWLNTPNTALGMVTPFSMLQTNYGRQEVHHVLGRIEWGVYS